MVSKALAISCYDDIPGLDRLLSSEVIGFFDKIIVIEGRYRGYPENPGYNPEFVSEFIKRISRWKKDKISYIRMDNFKQIEKRNRYFELASGFDFLLVLDSDEYCAIDGAVFENSLKTLVGSTERCFPLEFLNLGYRMFAPRLFYRPSGLHHKELANSISHGSIYDESDKEVVHDIWQFRGIKAGEYLKGIRLYHDKEKRSEERVINDLIYQSTVHQR